MICGGYLIDGSGFWVWVGLLYICCDFFTWVVLLVAVLRCLILVLLVWVDVVGCRLLSV